ncbi:MAG: hypothetical protein KAW09_12400 [Thermoplasmata archaeon]|nr:hypothetical protein [Thermoplasmata archaeon]
MEVVEIAGSRIVVLPVIRGPVSEESKVENAFNEWEPSSVALSISKGEMDTLKKIRGKNVALETFEEEIYVSNLEKFGEVRKPPPCFTKAVKLCRDNQTECIGVDMTEEEFTDAYCHFITTLEMMSESWFKSRIHSKTSGAESPEEFVIRFDKAVNKTRGHRELEREREKVMAHKMRMLAREQKIILGVIELERSAGVLSALKKKRG